jgi:hypothetical protein
MTITIEQEELKEVIREVIREELLNLAINLTPYISDKEMKDLEKRLGKEGFSEGEFVDGSKWLGR